MAAAGSTAAISATQLFLIKLKLKLLLPFLYLPC